MEAVAKDAFDNTFRVLHTRIDQFGVAQPNINPDRDRGIITVELPGIQDKERVRKYCNLPPTFSSGKYIILVELEPVIKKADEAFNV